MHFFLFCLGGSATQRRTHPFDLAPALFLSLSLPLSLSLSLSLSPLLMCGHAVPHWQTVCSSRLLSRCETTDAGSGEEAGRIPDGAQLSWGPGESSSSWTLVLTPANERLGRMGFILLQQPPSRSSSSVEYNPCVWITSGSAAVVMNGSDSLQKEGW